MMKFNPKIDHVLVTDGEAGPEGWELVPVQDLNVFYNPAKMDEADMTKIIEDFENGEGDMMEKVAYFDTALDRELEAESV
jgi:hypothetical protein